jgi:hypothetical protein
MTNLALLIQRVGPGWHRYSTPQPGRDYVPARNYDSETFRPSHGPFMARPGLLRWAGKGGRPVFYANPVQIPLDTGQPLWADPYPVSNVQDTRNPGNARLKAMFSSLTGNCGAGGCNGASFWGTDFNGPSSLITPAAAAAPTTNTGLSGLSQGMTSVDNSLFASGAIPGGGTAAAGLGTGSGNGSTGASGGTSGGGSTASPGGPSGGVGTTGPGTVAVNAT